MKEPIICIYKIKCSNTLKDRIFSKETREKISQNRKINVQVIKNIQRSLLIN